MGHINRAYVVPMKFWQDDDTTVLVRWYRAHPDAKMYVGDNAFTSIGREREDRVPIPPIGEQDAHPANWYEARNTGWYLGQECEGSPETWAGGGIHGITPAIQTDEHGGTVRSPWRGAPGPVVMATTLHGKGQVVLVGGESVLRLAVPSVSPTHWLLERLKLWTDEHGRPARWACTESKAHWHLGSLTPSVEYIGGPSRDFSTEELQYQLQDALEDIAVLLVGYWIGSKFADEPDLLHNAAVPFVHSWLNRGGILVLVATTHPPMELCDSPLNEYLRTMFVRCAFIHGDVSQYKRAPNPWHGFQQDPNYADFFWQGIPSSFFSTAVTSSYTNELAGGPRLLHLFTGWVGDPFSPSRKLRIRWVFNLWGEGADIGMTPDIDVFWLLGGFVNFTLSSPVTGTPQKYVVDWESYPGMESSLAQVFAPSMRLNTSLAGTGSKLHFEHLSIELWYCASPGPANTCNMPQVLANTLHPIVEGTVYGGTCDIPVPQACTIRNGDWLLAVCDGDVTPTLNAMLCLTPLAFKARARQVVVQNADADLDLQPLRLTAAARQITVHHADADLDLVALDFAAAARQISTAAHADANLDLGDAEGMQTAAAARQIPVHHADADLGLGDSEGIDLSATATQHVLHFQQFNPGDTNWGNPDGVSVLAKLQIKGAGAGGANGVGGSGGGGGGGGGWAEWLAVSVSIFGESLSVSAGALADNSAGDVTFAGTYLVGGATKGLVSGGGSGGTTFSPGPSSSHSGGDGGVAGSTTGGGGGGAGDETGDGADGSGTTGGVGVGDGGAGGATTDAAGSDGVDPGGGGGGAGDDGGGAPQGGTGGDGWIRIWWYT